MGLLALLEAVRGGPSERVIDVSLGVSVLAWAALGLVWAEPASRLSLARLTITTLNASVGVLLLFRRAIVRRASLRAVLVALPSLVLSGVSVKIAAPLGAWPLAASLLFAAGGAFTVVSLATLGRSFGLLPAVRGLVTNGPFRLVRHPAYLGELWMLIACAFSSPDPALGFGVFAAAAALLALRITVEERLLQTIEEHRTYAKRVRFRLIPWVW